MTLVKFRNPRMMFFDQMFGNDYYGGGRSMQYPEFAHPATNISEDAEGYKICMAVPGIEKDKIKIDLEKNELTISYEGTSEENDVKYIRREFNNHSFSRTFLISDKTNPEKTKAQYQDGILTLYIPKKEPQKEVGPRNIQIQ
jgi:HSP20 family protein